MDEYTKTRIRSFIQLVGKDQGSLLNHVFDMQDKFEQHAHVYNAFLPKIEEWLAGVESVRPVKGKDYFTTQDIEDVIGKTLDRIKFPEAEKFDDKKFTKALLAEVKKMIKTPKMQKIIINHNEIASKVMEMIPAPKDGLDGMDGKDGSRDTGHDIVRKLGVLPSGKRINAKIIDGMETFPSRMEMDYAVSTLRNQVSFLINKVEDLASQSGGSGGGSFNFETPVGAIDGSNAVFTVSNTPKGVVLNGIWYFEGDGYTFNSGTMEITLAVAPDIGSTLRSAY